MTRRDTTARLHAALDRIARRRAPMPPPQVLVSTPRRTVESGDQEQPFHAASVGKVMTATVVARLVERGRLRFDDPIGALLPPADVAGLPAAPGVDPARDVTVAHLLTHTSGLPDFFDPPRGHRTACSAASVAAHPDRRWTPAELIDEVRALPAVGRPGERLRYGDTGFVLLGRIVEEAAGERFNAVLRTEVLEPAGMTRSSTPYTDARTPADLAGLDVAPFWVGRHELSGALGLSVDWAGGGIVAPPGDLVRFQRALHGGHLVTVETLARLTRPLHRMRRGIHYGTGTATVRFHEFAPGLFRGLPEPVGGIGYFATHMFYYPRQDAHVVLNFHSSRRMNQSFVVHARIARMLATEG